MAKQRRSLSPTKMKSTTGATSRSEDDRAAEIGRCQAASGEPVAHGCGKSGLDRRRTESPVGRSVGRICENSSQFQKGLGRPPNTSRKTESESKK